MMRRESLSLRTAGQTKIPRHPLLAQTSRYAPIIPTGTLGHIGSSTSPIRRGQYNQHSLCGMRAAVDLTAGTCNTTLLKEFNLSSLAANMQQVVNFTDAAKWEKEKGDGIFSIMARMNDEDFDGANRESHPHAIGEPKNAAPMLNLTVLIDATKPIVNTTFNTSTPRNIDVLNFTEIG